MRVMLLTLGLLAPALAGAQQGAKRTGEVRTEWPTRLLGVWRNAADSTEYMTLLPGGLATVVVREQGKDWSARLVWATTKSPMLLGPDKRTSTNTLCVGVDFDNLTCRTYAAGGSAARADTIRADHQRWIREP